MSSSKKLSTKKSLTNKSADTVPSIEEEWKILKQEKKIWEQERQELLKALHNQNNTDKENKIFQQWFQNACSDNEKYFLEKSKALHERQLREDTVKKNKTQQIDFESTQSK